MATNDEILKTALDAYRAAVRPYMGEDAFSEDFTSQAKDFVETGALLKAAQDVPDKTNMTHEARANIRTLQKNHDRAEHHLKRATRSMSSGYDSREQFMTATDNLVTQIDKALGLGSGLQVA